MHLSLADYQTCLLQVTKMFWAQEGNTIVSLLKGAKVRKRHPCNKKTTKAGTKLHKAQRANIHKLEYSVLDASL